MSADHQGHADVMAKSAKTRQSEQGALKQGGIDLLVMPPSLNDKLSPWRPRSVGPLRRLVKRRNRSTLRAAQSDNLSFKRQGMTRRSMPCLFHANLFALDVARCPSSICGVDLVDT